MTGGEASRRASANRSRSSAVKISATARRGVDARASDVDARERDVEDVDDAGDGADANEGDAGGAEDVEGERGGKRARRTRAGDDAEDGSDAEDDARALVRGTRVVVRGNDRTKEKFVGARGVVKRVIDGGEWYRLVLEDGAEVKMRRNALTVIEARDGDEPESDDKDDVEDDEDGVENGEEEGEEDEEGGEDEDGEDEEEDEEDGKDNMKTRLRRPTRIPGNGPPSQAAAAAMKRLQERRRSARPNCTSNFERLTLTTLLKYKKVYGLEPNPETDSDKNAVAHEISRHFLAQKLDEQKVLQEFMCAVADTTQIAR